jgi:uncharacterized protein YraI
LGRSAPPRVSARPLVPAAGVKERSTVPTATATATASCRAAGQSLRRARRLPKPGVVLLLLVAMLAAIGPAPRPAGAAPAYTTSDVNLREGPGTEYAVLRVVPAGAYVEIVQNVQNGFYRVRYDGTSGWVAAQFLDRSGGGGNDGGGNDGGGGSGTATVTSSLNLRAGPSTGDAVLAVMPAGATVTLTGNSQNGFLSVSYNGTAGWAFADYLDTGSGAPAPNPTPSPSPSPSPGGSGTATVTTALNLRSQASTNSQVLAVMPAGATVPLTGSSQSGFLSVRYDGIDGWAYADYLDTGGSTPSPSPGPSPSPSPGGGTATTTTALNLRSGPGTNNPVLTVMPAGATVTLTGNSQNGFLSVSFNGTAGWASADYLQTGGGTPSPSPNPVPNDSATTTATLNLRAGPSLSDSVLTVMPFGSNVAVTGNSQNGFYPVAYNGNNGWASGDYLSFGGSSPNPSPNPNLAPGGGSGIAWPFQGGTVWEVIQGYNAYTHVNRSASAQYYYALDFGRVGGATAGQPIYSPVSGTVRWTSPSSGGIAIDMGNGYILAMFHCTFISSLASGSYVQQGQYLGTISGPGGPGYAVTPHLDMTLWRSDNGGFSRAAAPFSGGNAIGGVSFPDVGGFNQHFGTRVYP